MKFLTLLAAVFAVSLFLTSCNLNQPNETAQTNPYQKDVAQGQVISDAGEYYGRQNLDLQAVGPLLEKADSPENFEYLLNSDPRINNLDLNGDGYADYISVREFGDRNDGERGLSLFSRFGPDLIQEIATIILDRNGVNSRGARVLLTGNDQLYGDNYYYETNWVDRALPIVSALFGNNDPYYESPYYYNNYPSYYQPYQVVETPVYISQVREVYSEPVFVYTTDPTIEQIQIVSPYRDRTVANVYPVEPEKRAKMWNNRQGPPDVVPVRNGWVKNGAPKSDNAFKNKPEKYEKPRKDKPEKPEKVWKDSPKPQKPDRPNFKPEKPAKIKSPKMKPNKPDNPGRGNGKGGGNNPGKGGGGKGKGGGKNH